MSNALQIEVTGASKQTIIGQVIRVDRCFWLVNTPKSWGKVYCHQCRMDLIKLLITFLSVIYIQSMNNVNASVTQPIDLIWYVTLDLGT